MRDGIGGKTNILFVYWNSMTHVRGGNITVEKALLLNLKSCLKRIEERDSNLWRYEGFLEQLEKLRVKPAPIKYEGIGYSLGASVVAFWLVYYVPVGLQMMGVEINVASSMGWILSSLVISFLVGLWWGQRRAKKARAKIEAQNKARDEQFQRSIHDKELSIIHQIQLCIKENSRLNELVHQQCRTCGLHPDYQSASCVKDLIRYLETGRADSLKEALNLYETELHARRMEDEQEMHHRAVEKSMRQQEATLQALELEAQRQADAMERAAKSADDAAFWAGVTAYEVDKLSRDK